MFGSKDTQVIEAQPMTLPDELRSRGYDEQRWEYFKLKLYITKGRYSFDLDAKHYDIDSLDTAINLLGGEGWELVDTLPYTEAYAGVGTASYTISVHFFFKRRLRD